MPVLPRPDTFDALSQRYGPRYKWLVLLVIGIGAVAGVLPTSSFNVAIPALSQAFGLGQNQVQWAMTAFMMAMTVSMLPTPWLLDRFGLRRVFLLAVAILALASIAGHMAPTFSLVILARILQGAAAGVLQPLAVLVTLRLFPTECQGRAAGLSTLSIALTPAFAPALGGALLDRFGWEAIFLLNLPFCLVGGIAALHLLPLPKNSRFERFDWIGLGWLALATVALIEGVSSLQRHGVAAPWTLSQFVIVSAATWLFLRHAQRTPAPIINLDLFKQGTFAVGSIVSFAYGFGMYASLYLIPVFLQSALKYPAAAAGLALVPAGIALVLTLPLAGRLADRHPPKWVAVSGLAVFGGSLVIFWALGGSIHYHELIGATVLGRIGLGLILPILSLATLHHVAARHLGQSSVIITYARQLGGVMGIATTAVFVEWRESVHRAIPTGVFTAYSQGFLLLAIVILLALVAACFMRPLRRLS